MKYDVNIREEIFGATILDLLTGKREYVTKEELNKILIEGVFPNDSIVNKIVQVNNIKFTRIKKDYVDKNHFSFADIAYIELTRACNLKCKHCLNNSGKVIENQFKTNELLKLVSDLSNAGIQEIRFTGGEPLMCKDIFELIKLATQNGVYTSIGTNGTLITKEVANKLKEAGLKKAVVSIDGTEKMHDYIRGEGNYKKTIEGIKNLEENGIKVRVNSVIMSTNIEDVIKLAKEMHKNKIPLFIRRFIESGRGVNLKNNTLTKSDYDYLREKLSYELNNGTYINGHYLRNDEGIMHRIKLPFTFIRGCKAGQRAIVIMPDGKLHLCGFLAAQGFPSVGNAKDVNNWNKYWKEINSNNYLGELKKNLDKYNRINNVQPTNCLAYVQRFLNEEERKCL